MVNEKDLEQYFDEAGYLSLDNRRNYLQSIGVIKLQTLAGFAEVFVCKGADGRIHYNEANDEIDAICKKRRRNKHNIDLGSMGVDSSIVEKDVNKLDKARLTKIHETITADEIDF